MQKLLLYLVGFILAGVRAKLFFKEKNYTGAVADLSQATKLMPTDSDYRERAKAYEALGQKDLAQKDLAQKDIDQANNHQAIK
jgi:uncharacterized protein HemY